ncbi:hypothetical protein ACIBG8_48500 [Nonomuraea sp. NPDC050556]|uniref:hypothetical protein n=1 Tax=Nonomuraea sp. NPDC050556 TaxID=3364369 RepID=UPI00378C30C3
MTTDARIRLRYLRQTVGLLFPGPDDLRAYTVLPHCRLPRRMAPRRWWHLPFGPKVMLPVKDSIESHLSEVLGTPVRAVMHVRPARRANRKPILEAHDASGRVAFVKIGDTSRTCELITNEAAALRKLADLPLKTVVAPTVLHHGTWNGLAVLALSPLPVTRGKVSPDLLRAAVREIAQSGGQDGAAWHGDLSPWNICPSADGRLLVWDWERYEVGVPYGFDACHHLFQRALRGMRPAVAAQACLAGAVEALAPLGLSAAEARRTAIHYLIALADRHAADGHEPLGPPAEWLSQLVDHQELLT